MTLTHRLTFSRDGPKVITVTDSTKLPYTFEVGMFVVIEGETGIILYLDDQEPAIKVDGPSTHGWHPTRLVVADIDHPGTRGLLLAQYREASGHGIAAAVCREGWWCVDTDPGGGDSNEVVGEGESEGAAILDALTGLAESKAEKQAEKQAEGAAGLVRVSDTLADVRLDRIESMLVTIAERVGRLEDWMMTP